MGLKEYMDRTGNQTRWRLCACLAVFIHALALGVSGLVLAHQPDYGMAGAVAGGGIPKIQQQPDVDTVELESDASDAVAERHKPKPKPTPVSPTGIGGAPSGGALEVADYYRNPPPSYPDAARRLKEEGLVLLSVRIDAKGNPTSVSLAKSSGFSLLDDSAMMAVKFWRFKPATMAGIPFATSGLVPIRFTLRSVN